MPRRPGRSEQQTGRRADKLFTVCVCLVIVIAWVRLVRSAGRNGVGGGGDSSWAVQARLEICLVITAPLPTLLSYAEKGGRNNAWRNWVIGAHRLAIMSLLPDSSVLGILSHPPAKGIAAALRDCVHVFFGGRAFRLLFLGSCLQPDLPTHLLVHTVCTALALAPVQDTCAQPLLDSPLMESRLGLLNSIMHVPYMAALPPSYPPGGRRAECVAALGFLCIFFGWVVPTYVMLRTHCRAQAESIAASQPLPAPGSEEPGDHEQRQQQLSKQQTAALWILEHVFWEDAPTYHRTEAWVLLAAVCWLMATLLPASSATVALSTG